MMIIQKTLAEIADMIKQQTGKSVSLTQISRNTIQVHYLMKLDLTLRHHTDTALLFDYSLGWANFMAKGAAHFLGQIQTKKLTLDTQAQTVQVNLETFSQFKPLFKQYKITHAKIEDDCLTIKLSEQ